MGGKWGARNLSRFSRPEASGTLQQSIHASHRSHTHTHKHNEVELPFAFRWAKYRRGHGGRGGRRDEPLSCEL